MCSLNVIGGCAIRRQRSPLGRRAKVIEAEVGDLSHDGGNGRRRSTVALFVSGCTGKAIVEDERQRFFAKKRVQDKERRLPFVAAATGAAAKGSYLVDPASSHMLVSKIKPCKCKYELEYSETANGSLNQLWFI